MSVFFVPVNQAKLVPGWPGGGLGQTNQGFGPVLGIEIDTYYGNQQDPDYRHIGVNYTSSWRGFTQFDREPTSVQVANPLDFGMPDLRNSGVWPSRLISIWARW